MGNIRGFCTSIVLIIVGLSGNYVLKGTNSSAALVAVGFVLLVLNIIAMSRHNNEPDYKFDTTKGASCPNCKSMINSSEGSQLAEEYDITDPVIMCLKCNSVFTSDVKNGKLIIKEDVTKKYKKYLE